MRDKLAGLVQKHGDLVLAVALTTVALAQISFLHESPGARLAAAAGVVALGLAAARRVQMPLLLLSLLIVLSAVGALLPKHLGDVEAIGLFVLLAIYSAAAHTGGRRAVLAGALTVVMGVAAMATDPEGINIAAVVFYALVIGAPWVAGRAIRRRRLNEQRLEQEKANAEAAIGEERSRIARELHDVVAHAISVMVLQARGGRRVVAGDPDEAREAFSVIERTGHQALEEMRRLLGMLRASDEELALAPQPSLAQLDALVGQVRAAGLPVEVAVEGEPADLPPGVDLSAYRIVQEALTNALKHAGPARARVTVSYGDDELRLEIVDDGDGSGDGQGSGHGLIGMRERVSIYGGDLRAGRRPGGGYALRASLPLPSAET
jgi:signal transduction histidine kinase